MRCCRRYLESIEEDSFSPSEKEGESDYDSGDSARDLGAHLNPNLNPCYGKSPLMNPRLLGLILSRVVESIQNRDVPDREINLILLPHAGAMLWRESRVRAESIYLLSL